MGVVERPPTDEQKSALAEARSVHAAKIAELQILQRSKMAGVIWEATERCQIKR